MAQKLQDPLKRKISALAKRTRGARPRREIFEVNQGESRLVPSRSAYMHFENATSWPRNETIGRIETALGWKPGIVNEALALAVEPSKITVPMMRGETPFPVKYEAEPPVALRDDQEAPEATSSSVEPVTASAVVAQVAPELSTVPAAAAPAASASYPVNRTSAAPAMDSNPLSAFSDYQLARELALRAASRELPVH